MSRYYEVSVRIRLLPNDIEMWRRIEGAMEPWGFDEWEMTETEDGSWSMSQSTFTTLAGGKLESEASDEYAKVIWEAAGIYCEVECNWWFQERPPDSEFTLGEDDYDRIMEESRS